MPNGHPPQPPYDPRLRLTPEGGLTALRSMLRRGTGSLYEGLGLPADPAQWPRDLLEGLQRLVERPAETAGLVLGGIGQGVREQYAGAAQQLEQPGVLNMLRGWQQAIPLAGPGLTRAGQQLEQGDVAGAFGSTAAAGLLVAPFVPPAMRAGAAVRKAYTGSRWASETGTVSLGGTPPAPEKPAPPFYSALERAVEERLPNRASPEQIRATLRNAGVSPAEIEASGLEDFFTAQHPELRIDEAVKQPIAKQTMRSWLVENQVKVEERRGVSGFKPQWIREADLLRQKKRYAPSEWQPWDEERLQWLEQQGTEPTKFAAWQLPGGENYREVKLIAREGLALREARKANDAASDALLALRNSLRQRYGEAYTYSMTPAERVAKDRLAAVWESRNHALSEVEATQQFSGGHWDEPNVLAHFRVNDRIAPDGAKTLFVEEVQSDWARELREQTAWPDIRREQGVIPTTPDHPLIGRWPEVAAKRILKMAADEGYDRVAWTTGVQQAERYDLSKYVEQVAYRQNSDRTFRVDVVPKGADTYTRAASFASAKELPGLVGKDLADKMVSGQGELLPNGNKTFTGLDLRIGGEWAANLYDKQLPNLVNKLVKRWGGRVRQSAIDLPFTGELQGRVGETAIDALARQRRGESATVHSLDLPPAMRDAIRKRGFPLFEGAAGAAALQEWMRQRQEPQPAQ